MHDYSNHVDSCLQLTPHTSVRKMENEQEHAGTFEACCESDTVAKVITNLQHYSQEQDSNEKDLNGGACRDGTYLFFQGIKTAAESTPPVVVDIHGSGDEVVKYGVLVFSAPVSLC